MKQYKAILFDWDGTAVQSRKAPADEVAARMKRLLAAGVKLAVISGTTAENIGDGRLHEFFTPEERKNLYYGLARGAYNYHFGDDGAPEIFCNMVPERETMVKVHRACYEVHERLFSTYGFPTDIVFSRPNYCKIDLMVENDRGENLFFQEGELGKLKKSMERHGIPGGLTGLLQMALDAGTAQGLKLSATTDAKYLEAGLTSKSDNVGVILGELHRLYGITPKDCAFWGDEYVGMDEGLYGSDSFMITEASCGGDFFDVSEATGKRPEPVVALGGGVETFLAFLDKQAEG